MKIIKILTSIVFVITILFVITDYSERNKGTSIFFKGKEFPYGVRPKVYGDDLPLFITKENYILTGDNQYIITNHDTCFIKNLERFAHDKNELIVLYRDYENHSRFMKLINSNDSLFFTPSSHVEFFNNSLQRDYFGYNLFLVPFMIVLIYLAYMLLFFILMFKYKNIKYCFVLCLINLLLFIYSDSKLGELGGPYNVILFPKENPLSLFSPGAFLTPEDWDKFLDSSDPKKYYEISSSINKANKYIVLQKFQNNRIITIKQNYDETEEIISQRNAVSLLKNTKTFWGDTYENKQKIFVFFRFFSALFTLLYVIFGIITFFRHKRGIVSKSTT